MIRCAYCFWHFITASTSAIAQQNITVEDICSGTFSGFVAQLFKMVKNI
jgi:hypothetical protein